MGVNVIGLVAPSQLSSPEKTPFAKVPVNSSFTNGSFDLPSAENLTVSPFCVTASNQVFVNGSMFNFASSKFIEREPVVPSGLVTAPSQLPVKVSRKAIGEAVGVGGNGVGGKGVAVGEAQADSTQSRRRVEMMRMGVNITQLVVFITTLQRGLLKKAG